MSMGLGETETWMKMMGVGVFLCYQGAVRTQGAAVGNGDVHTLLITQR